MADSFDVKGEIAAAATEALEKRAAKRAELRRGTVTVLPPDQIRFNDLTNANRFLWSTDGDLAWVPEIGKGKWLVWDGKHWGVDNDDFVFRLLEDFAHGLYESDRNLEGGVKNAKHVSDGSGFNSLEKMAKRKATVSISSFDRDEYVINCLNGTVDIRTGEKRDHRREDRITKLIRCDYDPEAACPAFERFLSRIQPNAEIRDFLQRSIGYSLLGRARERAFWILYGTGRNGKSIFCNLFLNLMNEYSANVRSATIMQKSPTAIPNDIARLKGRRFILVPETDENERLAGALVKSLSGGDKTTCRFLFGEEFEYYFSGKLWIMTNHKPTITDPSQGMWDRVKLVPFNEKIGPEEVIKEDALMAMLQSEYSGILNWAIRGAFDYFERDSLHVPAVIQDEIDRYRFEQDSVAQFLEECCYTIEQMTRNDPEAYVNESAFRVSNPSLYAAYKKFCADNGMFLFSQPRLSRNLIERGFRQRNSGGRFWEGIRLQDE